MPALVNSSVGSVAGKSGLERTRVWPCRSKYCRNFSRISLPVMISFQFSTRGKEIHHRGQGTTRVRALARALARAHSSELSLTATTPAGLPVWGPRGRASAPRHCVVINHQCRSLILFELFRSPAQKQIPAAANDRRVSSHRLASLVCRASEHVSQLRGRSSPLPTSLRKPDRAPRRQSACQSSSARDRAAIFVCRWAFAARAGRQSCARTWRHRDSRIHADARSLLQLQLWLRRGLRAIVPLALRPSAAWRRATCPRAQRLARGLLRDQVVACPPF